MTETHSQPLNLRVAGILQSIDYRHRLPRFSTGTFFSHCEELTDIPREDRPVVAKHLLAFGSEVAQRSPSSRELFVQLCILAGLAENNLSQEFLQQYGIDAEQVTSLFGPRIHELANLQ